ncbi:MAG: hypothetical protein AAB734_03115 [Patescibacteria group bacterium]
MVRKKKRGVREHLLGLIIMVGVCATALAFASGIGVDNLSQVAMGAAANEMCKGGKDAKCLCDKGIDPKTGKCGNVKGGGKINCKCEDKSAKTTGFCKVVGKCEGTAIEGKAPMLPMMMPMMMGMPPMLPMIPMGMPSMDMPMMPKPCVPKTATSTTATTTEKDPITGIMRSPIEGRNDPSCEDAIGGGAGGGSWFPNFGGVSNMFNSPDDTSSGGSGNDNPIDSGAGSGSGSLWGRLMQSLGLSVDSEDLGSDGTSRGGVGGSGGTGSSTGNVQSGRGNESAKSTTGATTDFAIIGSGSTFSYAEDVGFAAEASVLEEIAKTLKKLLAIVMSWF